MRRARAYHRLCAVAVALTALGSAWAASAAVPEAQTSATPLQPATPIRQPVHTPATPPPRRTYTYTFNLLTFQHSETRSLHEDTDFVAIAVGVGANAPITPPAVIIDHVNNGAYAANLTIANVPAPPGEAVTFAYTIVNTSANPADVQRALREFLQASVGHDQQAAPSTVIGRHAGEWQIKTIIFSGCDGTVAAGHHGYTGAQLAAATSAHDLTGIDENPGDDSPTGCGSNSDYAVTWSIAATPSP